MALEKTRRDSRGQRGVLVIGFFAAAFCLCQLTEGAELSGKRPNIVFCLTDDQGYGDLSAHGNPVLKTPNLDWLWSQSVRFTDFHVSPTCAPTRSALFTGRHEFKNGVTHTILERERLTLNATTLAQVLQRAGYATGIFGKWHLGDEADYRPNRRGFNEVFIHGAGGIGQNYPGSGGDAPDNTYFDPAILHNGKFVKTTGYCTDVFYTQAMKWIESVKGQQPFFAYIPTNAPHAPYTARPADAALYAGAVPNDQVANFFGMIHNIDENIGRLLKKLDEWGIADNTLLIFMNDNGGTAGTQVYNAGMRGNKGTAWLGGTRAASFWRWPGTLTPGDCRVLTAHIDFFPTLAEIAGVPLTAELQMQVEGRSLTALLADPSASWAERVLFTHLGRWPKNANPNDFKFAMCSIRTTRWHLVSDVGGKEPAWKLFDVAVDYAERNEISAAHPGVVHELAAHYETWWTGVQPLLINEGVVGPNSNPFKELYWQQFGGGPTPALRELMDPHRPWPVKTKPAKKK
jgi:arylsulfatase